MTLGFPLASWYTISAAGLKVSESKGLLLMLSRFDSLTRRRSGHPAQCWMFVTAQLLLHAEETAPCAMLSGRRFLQRNLACMGVYSNLAHGRNDTGGSIQAAIAVCVVHECKRCHQGTYALPQQCLLVLRFSCVEVAGSASLWGLLIACVFTSIVLCATKSWLGRFPCLLM